MAWLLRLGHKKTSKPYAIEQNKRFQRLGPFQTRMRSTRHHLRRTVYTLYALVVPQDMRKRRPNWPPSSSVTSCLRLREYSRRKARPNRRLADERPRANDYKSKSALRSPGRGVPNRRSQGLGSQRWSSTRRMDDVPPSRRPQPAIMNRLTDLLRRRGGGLDRGFVSSSRSDYDDAENSYTSPTLFVICMLLTVASIAAVTYFNISLGMSADTARAVALATPGATQQPAPAAVVPATPRPGHRPPPSAVALTLPSFGYRPPPLARPLTVPRPDNQAPPLAVPLTLPSFGYRPPASAPAVTTPSLDSPPPPLAAARTMPAPDALPPSVVAALNAPSLDSPPPPLATARTMPAADALPPSVVAALGAPSLDSPPPPLATARTMPAADALPPSVVAALNAPSLDSPPPPLVAAQTMPSPAPRPAPAPLPTSDTLPPSVAAALSVPSLGAAPPPLVAARTMPAPDALPASVAAALSVPSPAPRPAPDALPPSVAIALDVPARAPPATPPHIQTLPAATALHLRIVYTSSGAADGSRIETLTKTLQSQDQDIATAVASPGPAADGGVVYFFPNDRAGASRVAASLAHVTKLPEPVMLVHSDPLPRPGTIEIRLSLKVEKDLNNEGF
jgi:hypothetical protein